MTKIFGVLSAAFFLVAAVTGCQVTNSYYLGARVDKEKVFPLVQGTSSGQVWQDLNLTINYDLKVVPDAIAISGTVGFSGNPLVVYQQVSDMKVTFYLLDSNNRVVSYRQVSWVLSRDLEELTAFYKELKRPAEAVAYTFGYEGGFIDEEGWGHMVWSLPRVDD